ncbi:MAG: erythromycin esterase family protein [Verrucomicrobia bacterium]|nr:erythromycin esterase family protein [Verrucomicrobiota bacterium]
MRLILLIFVCAAAVLPVWANPVETFFATKAQALNDRAAMEGLISAMSERRLVLLGEATHGTREFYTVRDRISRQLIEKHGFSFIAVEGDWTALLPLDRYVRHLPGAPASAREALLAIDRWPLWMWANEEMVDLGEWLRAFNKDRMPEDRVGIHGIDVYGLWRSMRAVIEFYQEHFPEYADSVREYYSRLQPFEGNNSAYVRHLFQLHPSARQGVEQVVEKLQQRHRSAAGAQRSQLFTAKQHAKVVRSAEQHLRYNIMEGPHSWNARARHFADTTFRLLDYYGEGSRGIVWAHNTHVGDARATSMGVTGEVNIGQIVRQQIGPEHVFILGFGTGTGQVLAASNWESEVRTMTIPNPPQGTLEGLLMALGEATDCGCFTVIAQWCHGFNCHIVPSEFCIILSMITRQFRAIQTGSALRCLHLFAANDATSPAAFRTYAAVSAAMTL